MPYIVNQVCTSKARLSKFVISDSSSSFQFVKNTQEKESKDIDGISKEWMEWLMKTCMHTLFRVTTQKVQS